MSVDPATVRADTSGGQDGVTPERLRCLFLGLIDAWGSGVEACCSGMSCRFLREGTEIASLVIERHPFGTVWRIGIPGRRDRVHESVLAALRSLRQELCPDRPGGRVLFVRDDQS